MGQLVQNVSKRQGFYCEKSEGFVETWQCKVVIELDIVSHLDDFVKHCLIKLWIVIEIERPIVILFTFQELL